MNNKLSIVYLINWWSWMMLTYHKNVSIVIVQETTQSAISIVEQLHQSKLGIDSSRQALHSLCCLICRSILHDTHCHILFVERPQKDRKKTAKRPQKDHKRLDQSTRSTNFDTSDGILTVCYLDYSRTRGSYMHNPLPLISYCGPMGLWYANQVDRRLELWDIRGFMHVMRHRAPLPPL